MRSFAFCLLLVLLPSLVLGATPELWLYYQTNLLPDENITKLEAIWRRASAAGYRKVLLADFKFGMLGKLGDNHDAYYRNVGRVRAIADELDLEIIPAVFGIGYSNALLANDPNLAEGLPVRDALFEVRNSQANLVADPTVQLAPKPDWMDKSYTLEDGIATSRGHAGNARLVWKVKVTPYRAYHVAVKVRTRQYSGEPEIKPIAGNAKVLAFTKLAVKRDQDWTEHHIVFGSLEHEQVSIYLGVWGDATGELAWRDWKLEEVGLLNVLRRPGAPCIVTGYVEGKDYEPIRDERLGVVPWAGDYSVWHEPPAIKTRGLADGTKLRVSWYFPMVVGSDQVCCCISEPGTIALLADEAKRIADAWNPKGVMMSHDEVRLMNWDQSCQVRKLTPGQMLALNVGYCAQLLGDRDVYVWNDMFDPHHNAKADYYLVNGDMSGSWQGLSPRVTIVNWHFGNRDKSLPFFADRGHRQVIAGYYDGDVQQINSWLDSAKNVRGVSGVMYTTWESKYDDLERFAEIVRSRP